LPNSTENLLARLFRCKRIDHLDPVDLETGDSFLKRRVGLPLEPCRRAPSIVARGRNQAMVHRILIDILQPGIIRTVKRDARLEELIPHAMPRRSVKFVDPLGDLRVQLPQEDAERFGVVRRGRQEVVVVST